MRLSELASFLIGLGLIAVTVALIGNSYLISVLNFIGISAIAVMGIVIIVGYAGQIVLGHAAFMGIGAYTSAVMTVRYGWPAPLGVAAAILLAAAVAFLAGKPILRLKGFYLALATLALAVVADSILAGWSDVTDGPSGFTGIGPFGLGPLKVVGEWPNFVLIYFVVVVALAATLNIARSMAGTSLRVLNRDEELAAAIGVSVSRTKTAAFVLSAILAALAGSLYAHYLQFISPSIFDISASFELLLVGVLGGVWTPYGAIIGAALLKFLPEALGGFRDYRLMAYGVVFILITFFLPDGIAGLVRDIAARWPKKDRVPLAPCAIGASRRKESERQSEPAALQVIDLSKFFLGLKAVSNVRFDVPAGQITALIGPNGAGKSTTVNLIAGLLTPDRGRIVFDGVDLVGKSPDAIARMGVARTFQNVRLLADLSLLENVTAGYCARTQIGLWRTLARPRFARSQYRKAQAEALCIMEELGLARYGNQPARELPLGLQRLAEIARALVTRPRLLLIDEPAAGLNETETAALGELLKQLVSHGVTILLIEHNMQLVQAVARSIVVLHYGQLLAEGAPVSVLRNQDVVEAYLGPAFAHAPR